MAKLDLVIRGGLIIDGLGNAPVRGDIGIHGGRIDSIGRVDAVGTEEIDAAGYMVTPGFVDVHTHYDGQAVRRQHQWHRFEVVI